MPNQLAKSMHEIAKQNRISQRGPTNADRIRGMSNEEMAAMFCTEQDYGPVPWCKPIGKMTCEKGPCKNCFKSWLRQPAEEVHDGQTI